MSSFNVRPLLGSSLLMWCKKMKTKFMNFFLFYITKEKWGVFSSKIAKKQQNLFNFRGGRVASHLCVLATDLGVPWNNVTKRQNLSEIEKKKHQWMYGICFTWYHQFEFIFQSKQEMFFFPSQVLTAYKLDNKQIWVLGISITSWANKWALLI